MHVPAPWKRWMITVLAVGAGLTLPACGVSSAGHPPRSGASSASGRPAVHPTPPGPIASVDMVTVSTGWAVTISDTILRTTNGGTTWTEATPPIPISTFTHVSLAALGPTDAWVTGITQAGVTIYRTTTGGQHWTVVRLPAAWTHSVVASRTQFLTANLGFGALFQYGVGGSNGVLVLRSQDGGRHWAVAADGFPGARGPGIPLGGNKTGFAAVTPDTLWLSGSWLIHSFVLGVSYDGGTIWTQETVPVPANVAYVGSDVEGRPPHFWNAQDGTLPVVQLVAPRETLFYHTTDSGHIWSATRPVPGTVYALITPNRIIVADGRRLYGTHDGGASWSLITHETPLAGVTELQFVNSEDGWGVGSGTIWRTKTGGRTWQTVPLVVK